MKHTYTALIFIAGIAALPFILVGAIIGAIGAGVLYLITCVPGMEKWLKDNDEKLSV